MLFFMLITVSFAMSSNTIYQWLIQENPTSKSIPLLNHYPSLSASFSQELMQWTQRQLAKSAATALRNYQQGDCTEGAFFKVVDGTKILNSPTAIDLQFTNSLFLIESSYCLTELLLSRSGSRVTPGQWFVKKYATKR